MTIARVRCIWTGPNVVGGGVTDLYFFGSTGEEGNMVQNAHDLWEDAASQITIGQTVSFDPNVVNLNEGDGSVVSIVTLGSPPSPVNGSAAGNPLARATQGLMRWNTAGIVGNRRVQGRTFVPSPPEGGNDVGVPNAGYITAIEIAQDAYIANPNAQPVVWSRPLRDPDSGTIIRPGSLHTVESGSCWTQWAVLRSRRD